MRAREPLERVALYLRGSRLDPGRWAAMVSLGSPCRPRMKRGERLGVGHWASNVVAWEAAIAVGIGVGMLAVLA